MNSSDLRSWRLTVAALFTTASALLAADNAPNPAASLTAGKPAKRAAWQERFTLGPGDVLNFALIGSPELRRDNVVIGPDGRVSYLQAQDVTSAGLTVDELRAKFDQELAKYYRSPRTIITPAVYRSKKYLLLGAVAQKGVFPFDRPLSVIEAIGRAGGFETGQSAGGTLDLADLPRSFLVRGSQRLAVDFEKLFQQGDLTQNIALEPDDYLYFPPSNLNEIYVLGEVNNPGTLAFQPRATAISAITLRGGFSERAWRRHVLVVRGGLKQPQTFVLDVAEILTARAKDFPLEPKDIIYVHERPWIKAEELLERAANAFAQAALIQWTGANVFLINDKPTTKPTP